MINLVKFMEKSFDRTYPKGTLALDLTNIYANREEPYTLEENVKRALFKRDKDCSKNVFVEGIASSSIMSSEGSKALVDLYDKDIIKVSVLKSDTCRHPDLTHVIITFKKASDAVKYGVAINMPEIIHAAFIGDRFITGYAFAPLHRVINHDNGPKTSVSIVVLQVPINDETIFVIGTAKSGADALRWSGEIGPHEPKIPFIKQACEIFTPETIKQGLWELKNPTYTYELNDERAIIGTF
jgi:hypothetical protein